MLLEKIAARKILLFKKPFLKKSFAFFAPLTILEKPLLELLSLRFFAHRWCKIKIFNLPEPLFYYVRVGLYYVRVGFLLAIHYFHPLLKGRNLSWLVFKAQSSTLSFFATTLPIVIDGKKLSSPREINLRPIILLGSEQFISHGAQTPYMRAYDAPLRAGGMASIVAGSRLILLYLINRPGKF